MEGEGGREKIKVRKAEKGTRVKVKKRLGKYLKANQSSKKENEQAKEAIIKDKGKK